MEKALVFEEKWICDEKWFSREVSSDEHKNSSFSVCTTNYLDMFMLSTYKNNELCM